MVGFVPTMGALHKGHISLLNLSVRTTDISVVSIFVNPTQFNNADDLRNYPRNVKSDIEMLEKGGCHAVFVPSEREMYPEADKRQFEFGLLGQVMEGKHRPGHFNGVAQIVTKLFDAVEPDKAFFGQKDFQQLAVIRKITSDLNYPVEIVAGKTIREADGLAMSSRNILLSDKQRKEARRISETLFSTQRLIADKSISEIKNYVTENINASPEMQLEYFEVVDNETLESATALANNRLTACIAVQVGKVRLIDNVNYF